MVDTSDRMPDHGYLLPVFRPGWLPRPTTATPVLGVLDSGIEQVRVSLDALHDAHSLETATDSDLDDLVALLDITRLAGETDEQLRARTQATARHGISASAGPDMVLYLEAATGLPATVTDWAAGLAGFDAVVVGNNGLLASLPDLIRKVKALGYCFRAYAVIGSQAGGSSGLGEFGLGEQVLGAADARVFLGS